MRRRSLKTDTRQSSLHRGFSAVGGPSRLNQDPGAETGTSSCAAGPALALGREASLRKSEQAFYEALLLGVSLW